MCYTDYDSRDDNFIENVKTRLRADLRTPRLAELVRLYFDPKQPFAGRDFDDLGTNDPDRVTIDDLLAASLLDITWQPLEVRSLLNDLSGTMSEYLAEIGTETDLWDATKQELQATDDLWNTLLEVKGIGEVKASKLLARKRPRLAPITDRVIVAAIGARGRTWPVLRHCLQDEPFRDAIAELRGTDSQDTTVLRLLDVALWMLYSGSEAAIEARRSSGLLSV
jgi:hypothetical protein